MTVGDRLSLHRQLHLDARLGLGVEDGHAHALLHARSEHRGRRHQIAPGVGVRGGQNKWETVKSGEEEKKKNKCLFSSKRMKVEEGVFDDEAESGVGGGQGRGQHRV